MKRLFISLLLLVPVMTFAGCGAGDDSSEIDITALRIWTNLYPRSSQ